MKRAVMASVLATAMFLGYKAVQAMCRWGQDPLVDTDWDGLRPASQVDGWQNCY